MRLNWERRTLTVHSDHHQAAGYSLLDALRLPMSRQVAALARPSRKETSTLAQPSYVLPPLRFMVLKRKPFGQRHALEASRALHKRAQHTGA